MNTANTVSTVMHLARPNPVRKAIEHDAHVTFAFTVIGDYAFVPCPWKP